MTDTPMTPDADGYDHPAIDAVIEGMEAGEATMQYAPESAPIHGAVTFLSTLAAAGYRVVPADTESPDAPAAEWLEGALRRSGVELEQMRAERDAALARVAELDDAIFLQERRTEAKGRELVEARADNARLRAAIQQNIDWLDSTSVSMHPMSTHAVANSLRVALAATPTATPDRCPTCGSDDPVEFLTDCSWAYTPDPWHEGSG